MWMLCIGASGKEVYVDVVYRCVWQGSGLIFFVIAQELLSGMILCHIYVTFRRRTTHDCQTDSPLCEDEKHLPGRNVLTRN